TLPDLNVQLPFLLAIDKVHFTAIRGYDEDFTGIAFDDNDLIALDSILSLSRTKNRWLLEVKDVDAALNELLKFARTCSVKILELSTHQSNLEDIFVKIIKGCVEN
ncbi:MAG: DUF4162 domain-containing protein, partial [Promethearchaeota archaeon]